MYPQELVYPTGKFPGAIRVKVAAICVCIDLGSFEGFEFGEDETAPFLAAKKSSEADVRLVLPEPHQFVSLEPRGRLGRAVAKVTAAMSDSILRCQLPTVRSQSNLDGEIDPIETWILLHDFLDWCESRGLDHDELCGIYWDNETNIPEAAVYAADKCEWRLPPPIRKRLLSGRMQSKARTTCW